METGKEVDDHVFFLAPATFVVVVEYVRLILSIALSGEVAKNEP